MSNMAGVGSTDKSATIVSFLSVPDGTMMLELGVKYLARRALARLALGDKSATIVALLSPVTNLNLCFVD